MRTLRTVPASTRSLRVEPVSRTLYWSEGSRFGVADLDGNLTGYIPLGSDTPQAFAIDPRAKQIYYADTANGRLRRISMDGTGAQTLRT